MLLVYHLHTLMHYFVTRLLHQGVDKQTVAELAGQHNYWFRRICKGRRKTDISHSLFYFANQLNTV